MGALDLEVTLVGPPALAGAWRRSFVGTPVRVVAGDILRAAEGGAVVSPANSFGWMTGGLDEAIRRVYARDGTDIIRLVQAEIREHAAGELPVGMALVVPTPQARYTHLVVAPTMRVPRPVLWTMHAYLAFRAALLATRAWNAAHRERRVTELFCPGLATGVGRMPAGRAARQMRAAWDQVAGAAEDMPSLAVLAAAECRLRHGR